jgi:hypothetical protein
MAKNKCAQTKCRKSKCKNNSCDEKSKMPVLEAAAETTVAGAQTAQITTQTETITDPAATIVEKSAEFNAAYSKYLALRELARPLNGLSQSDPLPANVAVTKVAIEFSVDGKPNTAEIPGVLMIGDLAALIGNGLRRLLETMHNDLHTIGFVTNSMQQVVKNAASKTNANAVSTLTTQSIPITVNTKPTLAQQ